MIDEIRVRDLALIHEADLSLSTGLTVLTGETGAGKTALLSALKLLIGERADAAMVREGEPFALVEGRFYRTGDDAEGLVVQRRVGADGRSRVKIDGALGSVRELANVVAPMVDLCGQHEHQRLLDPQTHVAMVDAWAGAAISGALADSVPPRVSSRASRMPPARKVRAWRTPVSPASASTRSTRRQASSRTWRSGSRAPSTLRRSRAAHTRPSRRFPVRRARSTL